MTEAGMLRESSPSVRRGAELLDKLQPGWYLEVPPDGLNMGCCEECVLGHLFGGFNYGLRQLRDGTAPRFDPVYNGMLLPEFPAASDIRPHTYEELTKQWRNEILARRSRAATADGSNPSNNPSSSPSLPPSSSGDA